MIEGKGYCIDARNVILHELIGLSLRVVKGTGRTMLKGRIVNETRNTLEIETSKGIRTLPKKDVVIELDLNGEKTVLSGKGLCFRPEDRTKELSGKRGNRAW